MTNIFTQMCINQADLTTLIPNASDKEYYFYFKAYKLVDQSAFYNYCQLHKFDANGNDKPFVIKLCNVLDSFYPPLQYQHDATNGLPGLDLYIETCKLVLGK